MMASTPSFQHLSRECLFCNPERHGQAEQILLRSDNFYLFAGLGAIMEGYVIIAPYRCDDPYSPARSFAELPSRLSDEFLFLRWLLADFYKKQFGTLGMSFEHGRAGACLATDSDTRHCYHAHLCCYPASVPLWEDVQGYSIKEIDGPPDLSRTAGSLPYLYVELFKRDDKLPLDRLARVVILPEESVIESQLLRRLLAQRIGEPDLWDWRTHHRVEMACSLGKQFHDWLRKSDRYAVDWNEGEPRIAFLRSVWRANEVGNDAAAKQYWERYRNRLIYGALGKFLSHLRDNVDPAPRVLDVGCGPGMYAHLFRSMGLRVAAIDQSDKMLEIARNCATNPEDFEKMDALGMSFEDRAFDAIWCSALLVHVPRVQAPALLSGLRRVLKDDGVLYLSARTGRGCWVQEGGRAFFYYTDEELQTLFREAGFEVVDAWGGASTVNALGGQRMKVWREYLLKPFPPRIATASRDPAAAATLLDLGERRLLERLGRLIPRPNEDRVVLGIGDDCAAVRAPGEQLVVATIDPCPTPVISLLGDNDPWYRGWFSMIISLSDLGAMGAKPLGILLSVEAPQDMPVADFDRFYAGVLEAAEAYGCPVLGGNLKDAVQFNCVGTALGSVAADRMLRRDAARPGERVVVLGDMGRFWAGVIHRLKRVHLPERADSEALLENLRKPRPRIREGCRLAERRLSRCAIDSSDGLTACFYEIARAGCDVDVHLDLSDYRPHEAVLRVAAEVGLDVRKLLLAWGDWQLVCTVRDADLQQVVAAMAELGCSVSVVGWIGEGRGRVWLHDDRGTAPLNYLANERFTRLSYFSYGLEGYLQAMRNAPLTQI